MHINNFPVEILSEVFEVAIFKDYLTPNRLTALLFSFRKRSAPFNLIHVCQHWRVVAFSTPTLWTFLDGTQHKEFGASIPAMSYWLQCSRNAPLHFQISSWQDTSEPSLDPLHARKMLQVFSGHLSRWRSISVEAGNDLAGDLITVLKGASPPLEGLEVEFGYGDAQQQVVDELASSIYNVKTLRRLYWMNAWGHALPNLPWGQYETISIRSSFVPEEVLQLVAQCVSAKSVTVHGSQSSEHRLTLFNQPHATLTILTSLILNQSSDPLPFLSCFTLPSLRHLEITLNQREFHFLEAFLKRSNCPLQVLIIADITLLADGISQILGFPWLKPIPNVKLAPTYSDKQMLRFLKNLATSSTQLPFLVVWMETFSNWPVFIGWKESGIQGALYALEAGKLTTMS